MKVVRLTTPLAHATLPKNPEIAVANPLQVNFYYDNTVVAIGSASYGSHADVKTGMEEYCKELKVDTNAVIPGLIIGHDVYVRIDNSNINPKNLENHRKVLNMATALAQRLSGNVRVGGSNEAERLAKILGCYHLKDDRNNFAFTKERIRTFSFGRCIYHFPTGTRYIFPQTVRDLARQFQSCADTSLPQEDRQVRKTKLIDALIELQLYLNGKNRCGIPEARFFLLDPVTNTIRENANIHGHFADKFQRVRVDLESSTNWQDDAKRLADELNDIAKELEDNTTTEFFDINLSSQRFVDLVSTTLRGARDTDTANTTQRIPVEGGYFVGEHSDEARKFVVTTTDPLSRRVIYWAFSENNPTLNGLNAQIKDADYLVIYKLESTPHHEHHPAPFSTQFGHLEPNNGIVLEIGFRDGRTIELVFDEDVWSEESWKIRQTQVGHEGELATLRRELGEEELTKLLRTYKQQQYEFLRLIIQATGNESLLVADNYLYLPLPNHEASIGSDNTIQLQTPKTSSPATSDTTPETKTPYRARPWVNGQLANNINFDTWSKSDLEQALKHLADMMVVGIIAQLPHIPLHDINISRTNPNSQKSEIIVTLLSASESFCGIGGINYNEYINKLVPIICGNLIARFLAHSVASGNQEALDNLIDECVKQMALTFGRLVDNQQHEKTNILAAFDRASPQDGEGTSPPPSLLNIGKHLARSREILNLPDPTIMNLANSVREAAKRELRLIENIAPPLAPQGSPTTADLAQQRDAVNAVCACIWRHTQEQGVGKDADARDAILKKLEAFAELTVALSIAQRTWLITLIDFELRDQELELNSSSKISRIYLDANNEDNFRTLVRQTIPLLDLSDTDITNLYKAINGLKGVINSHESPNEFLSQMRAFLSPPTLSIISTSQVN